MALSQGVNERSPLLDSQLPPGTSSRTSFTPPGQDSQAEHAIRQDEEQHTSGLPPQDPGRHSKDESFPLKVVSVLMIGTILANADTSLTLSTHGTIASELNSLAASSWLFTSYTLAGAATQTVFAKLSDVYGRSILLCASYLLLAVGCLQVGMGESMGQLIFGRIVSGCGGAGMTVVSILTVTDLVPLRDLAAWNSMINLVAVGARSIGGPLGGWLADTIGWRWSFLLQSPCFALSMLLVARVVPRHLVGNNHIHKQEPRIPSETGTDGRQGGQRGGLSRIDWLGSATLAMSVLCFLLPLEVGGSQIPWASPLIFVLFGLSGVTAALFTLNEWKWAREPIFPLSLLTHRNLVLSCFVTGLQTAAQFSLMFSVPLYFQITKQASNSEAGSYLIPGVVGNALGALASGVLIKRYGRYKSLLIAGTILATLSYSLLIASWDWPAGPWQVLFIFAAGFGTGLVQASVFVGVQATVAPDTKAAATSAMGLSSSIGMITGLAASSAITGFVMVKTLNDSLLNMELDEESRNAIIKQAAESIDYIKFAEPRVAQAIISAYLRGFCYGHVVSAMASAHGFMAAMGLMERTL